MKALQELVLYTETIDHDNQNKYLIATNIYEWFLTNFGLKNTFSKQLKTDYENWKEADTIQTFLDLIRQILIAVTKKCPAPINKTLIINQKDDTYRPVQNPSPEHL